MQFVRNGKKMAEVTEFHTFHVNQYEFDELSAPQHCHDNGE